MTDTTTTAQERIDADKPKPLPRPKGLILKQGWAWFDGEILPKRMAAEKRKEQREGKKAGRR